MGSRASSQEDNRARGDPDPMDRSSGEFLGGRLLGKWMALKIRLVSCGGPRPPPQGRGGPPLPRHQPSLRLRRRTVRMPPTLGVMSNHAHAPPTPLRATRKREVKFRRNFFSRKREMRKAFLHSQQSMAGLSPGDYLWHTDRLRGAQKRSGTAASCF